MGLKILPLCERMGLKMMEEREVHRLKETLAGTFCFPRDPSGSD